MSDTHDRERDEPERPEDPKTGGYPPMPPLDRVDPDLEQEGEATDPPEGGWGGAARAATEEDEPGSGEGS